MRSFALLTLLLAISAPAFAAEAKSPAVLVTVNGKPFKRADVMDRAFKQYGTAVLNEMVDEALIKEEAARQRVKADPAKVAMRLKRIQDQFPDEATFKARLTASGTSLEELKDRIEDQLLREELVGDARKLAVSDGEVKDFFEANKEKLGQQESVRLRHILVSGEKEANDFLTALRAGADFAKLASSVSMDNASRERGGDLGFISRGMLQPEMEKVAFSMKPGEISSPIRSSVGFHILRVEESRGPKSASLSDMRKDLTEAIMADKIAKAWPPYLQELRNKAKYETPQ